MPGGVATSLIVASVRTFGLPGGVVASTVGSGGGCGGGGGGADGGGADGSGAEGSGADGGGTDGGDEDTDGGRTMKPSPSSIAMSSPSSLSTSNLLPVSGVSPCARWRFDAACNGDELLLCGDERGLTVVCGGTADCVAASEANSANAIPMACSSAAVMVGSSTRDSATLCATTSSRATKVASSSTSSASAHSMAAASADSSALRVEGAATCLPRDVPSTAGEGAGPNEGPPPPKPHIAVLVEGPPPPKPRVAVLVGCS